MIYFMMIFNMKFALFISPYKQLLEYTFCIIFVIFFLWMQIPIFDQISWGLKPDTGKKTRIWHDPKPFVHRFYLL